MGKLDGKVAFITGASRNMGGAMAHFMAKEGAIIAANDLVPEVAEETVTFLKSKGYEAMAVPGNVSDEAAVIAMVKKVVDTYGHIDILVNNAGKQYQKGVLQTDLTEWNEQLSVLLTGPMLLTREVCNVMVEKQIAGSVIIIASSAGHSGQPGNLAYCTSKGGLLNFARSAAMDLAQYGIRVNTITPTGMEHNLYRSRPSPKSDVMASRTPPPRTYSSYTAADTLKAIPLKRFPRTSDIAKAAVFLASDDSAMTTGADLRVDGGILARYHQWVPGEFSGISLDEYREDMHVLAWGEPVTD